MYVDGISCKKKNNNNNYQLITTVVIVAVVVIVLLIASEIRRPIGNKYRVLIPFLKNIVSRRQYQPGCTNCAEQCE